jgi:hypothetical protein
LIGLYSRTWGVAHVVGAVNNYCSTSELDQRLGQSAIPATKIENETDRDLGEPISHPIMHISDHREILSGLLVGGKPLRIVIEVSSQRPACILVHQISLTHSNQHAPGVVEGEGGRTAGSALYDLLALLGPWCGGTDGVALG